MKTPRVLLIGWDAADWQFIHPLLDRGLLPNLQRLVEGGVIANLASLQPMLSPILWTSIATGKRAPAHGVSGFIEPLPDRSGVRPVGTQSRRCKALWNIVSQSGRDSVVCGWQASHPAENIAGAMVSNLSVVPPPEATPQRWPIPHGSVSPAGMADDLADLRIHPLEVDGLPIQQLIPRAHELDQCDPFVRHRLEALRRALAQVISVHAIATELLEKEAWDFGAIYYECIDQVGHDFMPFHPPRRAEIAERDLELYGEVMTGIYRFHDLMLGRLCELARAEAHIMIVSDHGFESGARRPPLAAEPAQWHRAQGIFILHGPGIRADERIEGANLLDVAPTVLALLGLPIGDDMEGRPLLLAFDRMPTIERIPSWEEIPGADGRDAHGPEEENPATAQALLQQFVALGYIEPPSADTVQMVARAEAETDFNLAASLSESGKALEAKQLLVRLTQLYPDQPRYWQAFAQSCFAAQAPADAEPALIALERLQPHQPQTLVLRGLLAWSRDDLAACATAFQAADKIAPNDPLTQTVLGRLYLRQRRWPDAERSFRSVLAIDPDHAEAHYGLSVALPRQDRVEEGVDHALLAVGLRYEFPEAHFQLGAVLSRLGWFERAAQAFEISLRLRPGFILAHRYLSRIYPRIGRDDLARRHGDDCTRLQRQRAEQPLVD